MAMVSEFAW